MNRKHSESMKLYRGLLIGVLLTAAACSKNPETEPTPSAEPISVTIGAAPRVGIDVGSRTQVDDAGAEIKWSEDDRIALWAEASDATFAFEGAEFALWHYTPSWQRALFRGSVTGMDASSKYTYYATYPVPTSVNSASREVTYEIPAVQDGSFHGDWDIMVADPLHDAPALVAGDNSDVVSLNFHHQVHLLRIRIPANLLGESITQLTLTFPVDVTGAMTVDITDPQAQPRISGSRSVTLRFKEPKDAGDVVFATIAPVTLQETDRIEIVATGTIYESQTRSMVGKAFQAGHTTPISYTVPEAEKILGTMLRFSLHDTGENTLGEAIQKLWIEADGVTLEAGSAGNPFTVNAEGIYEILLPSDSEIPGLLNAAGSIKVYYDSEHATVTKEVSLPTITTHAVNEIPLPGVPYLFEEDFSGASAQEYTSSTNELSGIGLPGWGASRYEIQPGRAAFFMYVGTSTSSIDNRRGRMDTPFLPIKEGASVSIKVSYNIGAPIVEVGGVWPFTSDSKWSVTCEFGTQNDIEGAISGDDAMSNVLETYTPAEGGDFSGALPQSKKDFLINEVTGKTRLTWRASDYQKISGSAPITARYFYIYLDDIRVSINK